MAATIRIELQDDRAVVVRLDGDVDVESARKVRERLFDALDNSPDGVRLIVIDLSRADVLDSSGLGALVATYRRAHARECRFAVAEPTPMITRILEVTGLDKAWPVYPSVQVALTDLPPASRN